MGIRITEVFFKTADAKKIDASKQWFEVRNDGEQSINLKSASIRRLDKRDQVQVWEAFLPNEDLILEPQQYIVIAQSADLGQKLCSEHHRVIVLKELKLDSGGVQRLCINESCVKVSDTKGTEKGFSRNLLLDSWFNEVCELRSNFFASPGLPTAFCRKNIESGWTMCPEPVVEVKATERQIARHASGCQMVAGGADIASGLAIFLLLAIRWVRHLVASRDLLPR